MDRQFKYKRGDILERWDMTGNNSEIEYYIVVGSKIETSLWRRSRRFLKNRYDKIYYLTPITNSRDSDEYLYRVSYDLDMIELPSFLLTTPGPPRYYGWRKVGDLFHAQAI